MVLWNGNVGGAEVFSANLADRMRRDGTEVTIVFIGETAPMDERLSAAAIPYRGLAFARGRDVLRHPRSFASQIRDVGRDGALLIERGFMGVALRLGGYRGPLVSVEHGPLLFERQSLPAWRLLVRRTSRWVGARAIDAEVAVSDFMLERMREHAHANRIERIQNGIDPEQFRPSPSHRSGEEDVLTVGFVGRLIAGKGVDRLIQAVASAADQIAVRLLIAGDGPLRPSLESLAREAGADDEIEFLGLVEDIADFWGRVDVATVPSDALVESFSMVTLEAMACGKAVIATRIGAIPELVDDGRTGTLVVPGDMPALARAMIDYAENSGLRRAHGEAGRTRAIEHFPIEHCARQYLALFDEISQHPPGSDGPRASSGTSSL
jgi:glycosyltransferase involved in cell wall biosynthesis